MDKHVKLFDRKEHLHHWILGYISRKEKDVQGYPCAHHGGRYGEQRCNSTYS
jgi:hypothetical protein